MSTTPISVSEADVPALFTTVMAAGEELIAAIARETAALQGNEHGQLSALAEEKRAAVRLYESRLAALAKATDSYRALSAEQRHALHHFGGLLAQEADENARRLEVAVLISRRFMASVADAVRGLAPQAPGYCATGAPGSAQRGSARALAISLDRSL